MKKNLFIALVCAPLFATINAYRPFSVNDCNGPESTTQNQNSTTISLIAIELRLKDATSDFSDTIRFSSDNEGIFFRAEEFRGLAEDTTGRPKLFNTEATIHCTVSNVSNTEAIISYTIDDKSWSSLLISPFSWFFPKRITLPIGQEYREIINPSTDAARLTAFIIKATHITTTLPNAN